MKIVINKLVGDLGEQWSVEVPVPNDVLKASDPVAALKVLTAPALRAVDDRLLELNMRLLDSNRMAQGLTPEANMALRQVVEVLYGRRVAPGEPPGQEPQQPPAPGPDVVAQRAQTALEKALEATDEGGR